MSYISFLQRGVSSDSAQNFWFQPLPVGAEYSPPPVYWANDLFLRRTISMATRVAAVMAESGRTPAPRTVRHGYSRPPLSAARRTLDSRGHPRLAILLDQAAAAPPRAALHLAHPSDRPCSDPHDAAARYDRGSARVREDAWRLDRSASWPPAQGRTVSCWHSGAVARRPASHRASRRRARHGVDRDPRQRREGV